MTDEYTKKIKTSWSKTLVRKWFNIKSKSQDFQADNVSKRGGEMEWRTNSSEREAYTVKKSKTDRVSKKHGDRIHQGRVEQDTSDVTNVHEYRIMASTWNVGGKSPPSCLKLEDWLHASPPADIYVLGFQEIVPLNAGNVLGTEDNAPARKWVALIRKTLNNLPGSTCNPNYHMHSLVHPIMELDCEFERSSTSQMNSSFFHRRSFQSLSRSLRMEGDILASQHKLDRRFSVCDRVKFGIAPSDYDPTCGWDGSSDDENVWGDSPGTSHYSPMSSGPSIEERDHYNGNSRYCLVASKQMVGLFLTIWARNEIKDDIRNLKVSCVGRGLMGYLGNKGSISISMSLHQTTFCFICSHLTSGQKEGDELRRNSDVIEILKKTRFSHVHGIGNEKLPETILEHDKIIWLGDLNYRIALSYRTAKALVEMCNWKALLENDQLRIEQRCGRVFDGWNEGRIYFPPTYKYSKNSDRYFGDEMNPKKKRRTPAWCDRILWHGQGINQVSYVRGESRFSDHRPVYSIFTAEVLSTSHSRLKRNMSCSSSRVEVEEILPYSHRFSKGYTELNFV